MTLIIPLLTSYDLFKKSSSSSSSSTIDDMSSSISDSASDNSTSSSSSRGMRTIAVRTCCPFDTSMFAGCLNRKGRCTSFAICPRCVRNGQVRVASGGNNARIIAMLRLTSKRLERMFAHPRACFERGVLRGATDNSTTGRLSVLLGRPLRIKGD